MKEGSKIFADYCQHPDGELVRIEKSPVFAQILEKLREAKTARRILSLCGDGGSVSNADHFATESQPNCT